MSKIVSAFVAFLTASSAYASGWVEISPDTRTGVTRVTISSRVILPSETSNVGMARAQADLNYQLNKTFLYPNDRAPRFKVRFAVTAIRESEAGAPQPADNQIAVISGQRSHATLNAIHIRNHNRETDCAEVLIQPSDHASIAPSDLDESLGSNTLAHETLHLFGIDDRYHDLHLNSAEMPIISVTDEGFDFDIMGSQYGLSNLLHIRSFVDLATRMKASGKSSGLIDELVNFDVCNFSKKDLLVAAERQPN